MNEYFEKWENYVAENYDPSNMSRCKLDELAKIADIMKDMSMYWQAKMEMGMVD